MPVQEQDHRGQTALLLAAQVSTVETALRSSGLRSCVCSPALILNLARHRASSWQAGKRDAVKLLLDRRSDVNACSQAGRTALHQVSASRVHQDAADYVCKVAGPRTRVCKHISTRALR